jgi:uncharacterized protein with FMN-binding domain
MRKSVVTAVVTTMFVVYSFYQRTIGVQATADVRPSPIITSIASGSSQGPSGSLTPTPVPSSPAPAQANPSQAPAANAPTSIPQAAPTPTQNPGSPYKNGTYTGIAADAFYGNIQVQATIANGKLTNVQFLQWPNDRMRSVRINQQALPWLVQEAVQAQSWQVDVISGATDSSIAFGESLQSALTKAKS